jgi:hypothetical protein
MKERVIVKRVVITKRGEIQYFQIRLPRNAERIIGIETSISRTGKGFSEYVHSRGYAATPVAAVAAPAIKVPVPVPVPLPKPGGSPAVLRFQRNALIGELKLQSLERANVFYSSEVFESDRNVGFGDFSVSRFFPVNPWSHEILREPEPVEVDGITTLIGGVFTDAIGAQFKTNLSYQANVFVWYEIKDEDNDDRLCP